MRCFVIASGIVFLLILCAHVARLFAEGTWLFGEPSFIVTSLLSLGMAAWAAVLLWRRGSN